MKKTILAAGMATLLFGATLAPAMAQDADDAARNDANRGAAADVRADDADRVAVDDRRDEDHDFPWGLLGLLGLAGLMKGKQRTVVHNDTVRTTTANPNVPR